MNASTIAAGNGIRNQIRDLALVDRAWAIGIGNVWLETIVHEQIQLGAAHGEIAERLQCLADSVMAARCLTRGRA